MNKPIRSVELIHELSNSRERIAIRANGLSNWGERIVIWEIELSNSMERIAIRENVLSNSRERITTQWERITYAGQRIAQFDMTIYLRLFFFKIPIPLQGFRTKLLS